MSQSKLSQNTLSLQDVLDAVNNLPEAGSGDTLNLFLEGTLEEINCGGGTAINPYCFYNNPGLKRVTLTNAESVSNYNFYDCEALESVDLPNVTGMTGTYFCYSCSNLTSVNIPNVAGFGNYAFQSSSSVEMLDLPMVETIGNYAFRYCTGLTAVILRKTGSIVTLGGSTAFAGSSIASGNGYIYVPSALIEEYRAGTNWSKYSSKFRAIEDYPNICG